MMKIALLTDGIYPYVIGGMQKHSFYLAKYFALNKIKVDLYHTAPNLVDANNLAIFSEEERRYIHSYIIPFPVHGKLPGHYIRESYTYSSAIFERLKQNSNVNFIYVQGLSGMKLLENKKELAIPVGVNFHGLEMFQQPADLKTKLAQYLFRKPVLRAMNNADVVFSLGGKLTAILTERGIAPEKIIELPIGIDPSWIREKDLRVNTERKFVFTGRYERRKGIEELSAVISQLLPEHSFRMEFIGDIPPEAQIRSSAVLYHGSITDTQKIKDILSGADVLICPSYSEGMPTVILEAMASGMAIIASDVGAVSEQVNAGNGILILPGDRNGLKQAMITLMNISDEKLLQMKENSIKQIHEHFLWEKIIIHTIKRITSVLRS
jgi:glycosyltransferase involved in cell wall biosynthesis